MQQIKTFLHGKVMGHGLHQPRLARTGRPVKKDDPRSREVFRGWIAFVQERRVVRLILETNSRRTPHGKNAEFQDLTPITCSNHLKASLYLEKDRRLLDIRPFLRFDPGQIGLKKFYLGAIRDFIKQMRIGDSGTEKIKGQSDILFNDFIFSHFLNPLIYLSLSSI